MNEKVRVAHCGFCGVNLNSKNRAKEHVLRRSWLARLGHSKTPVPGNLLHREEAVEARNMTADQVLAGQICRNCNNGWMNLLDLQVEPFLLPLITDNRTQVPLTMRDARRIARWLLKTAAAHEMTDRAERRHMPTSLRRNIRKADWLPSGLWVFTCNSQVMVRGIGIASLDAWAVDSSLDALAQMPQSQRVKFGVGYDNLVIGICVYSGKGRPTFVGVEGLHHTLLTVGADVALRPSSESVQIMDDIWRHPLFGQSPVNLALGSVGLRIHQQP